MNCGCGSVVEHHLAKVRVASSNLVIRSGSILPGLPGLSRFSAFPRFLTLLRTAQRSFRSSGPSRSPCERPGRVSVLVQGHACRHACASALPDCALLSSPRSATCRRSPHTTGSPDSATNSHNFDRERLARGGVNDPYPCMGCRPGPVGYPTMLSPPLNPFADRPAVCESNFERCWRRT